MLAGAGSNVTVQVGPDAVMVVDTNEAAMSDKVLAAIRTLSSAPIRYIVNTSADPDHVGGNAALAKVRRRHGQRHPRSGRTRLRDREHVHADGQSSRWVITHANGNSADRRVRAPKKTLFVTGEPVEMIDQPAAHTDGDLYCLLPQV